MQRVTAYLGTAVSTAVFSLLFLLADASKAAYLFKLSQFSATTQQVAGVGLADVVALFLLMAASVISSYLLACRFPSHSDNVTYELAAS